MKKIASILLTLVLLAAFATASAETSKGFIAVLDSDTGSIDNVIFANSMRYLCGLAGYDVVFHPDTTYDADSCIGFVEKQIAAGAKGLVFCPPSDSVLPAIVNLCNEAGVYWAIASRSINDDDIRAMVEASQYYVGNCFQDEYVTGYTVMEMLNDMGVKNIAIISTAKGNASCDTRELAIAQACEDLGMSVLSEARNFTQPSEVAVACQSFLAAYEDLDAIFIVGTYALGATDAACKAIVDAGRADQVKLAAVDFGLTQELIADFESGVLRIDVISNRFVSVVCAAMVVNACNGYDFDGQKVPAELEYTYVTDLQTATEMNEIYSDEGSMYLTDEGFKSLLKEYNPDLTSEVFVETIYNWDPVADAMSANQAA